LKNKYRSRKKYILEKDTVLAEAVKGLLKEKRIITENGKTVKIKMSPVIISNLSKQGKLNGTSTKIGITAIYNAARSRKFGFSIMDLPHGRSYYKSQNKHTETKPVPERKAEYSIEKLPEEVKKKESKTHFEGDSIIGKAEGTNNTLITLVNTYSKFLFIYRSLDKTAKSFVEVLNKMELEIPEFNEIIETLLLDNGPEFSDIKGIMRSITDEDIERLKVYFAHPYASYERGCNENKNRQVRQEFAKGRLVEELTDEDILNIAIRINNTPRKSLGYSTAFEVFEEMLISKDLDTKFLDKYRIEKSQYLVA
jgi:IS30 family transposase